MSHIRVGGKRIELNPEGFLVHFEDWNEEVAETLAKLDNLTLDHCHWEAFGFLREYYVEYEVNPSPRIVVRTIGEKLRGGKCPTRVLDELFPLGGCKQACRLAGLPQYYPHVC